jgi:hypothetical protein
MDIEIIQSEALSGANTIFYVFLAVSPGPEITSPIAFNNFSAV